MNAKIDRTGHRYGRLLVLGEGTPKVHPKGDVSIHWICRCDCGVVKEVSGKALGSGIQISCGCAAIENAAARATTHGLSRCPEHRSWLHIIQRCCNPNTKCYKNYGGRGIAVCDEWRHSFEAFFAYVGKKPTNKHSIDRINNDGNYEPGNVRWATASEQANNKRHMKKWSVCMRGHDLTPENLYIQKKTGARFCKKCRDIREARPPPRVKHKKAAA